MSFFMMTTESQWNAHRVCDKHFNVYFLVLFILFLKLLKCCMVFWTCLYEGMKFLNGPKEVPHLTWYFLQASTRSRFRQWLLQWMKKSSGVIFKNSWFWVHCSNQTYCLHWHNLVLEVAANWVSYLSRFLWDTSTICPWNILEIEKWFYEFSFIPKNEWYLFLLCTITCFFH